MVDGCVSLTQAAARLMLSQKMNSGPSHPPNSLVTRPHRALADPRNLTDLLDALSHPESMGSEVHARARDGERGSPCEDTEVICLADHFGSR